MLRGTLGLNINPAPIDEYDETILAFNFYFRAGEARYCLYNDVKVNEENGFYLLCRWNKDIEDCIRRLYFILGNYDAKGLYQYLTTLIPSGSKGDLWVIPEGAELSHTYCEYRDPETGKSIQRLHDPLLPTIEEFCALKCHDTIKETNNDVALEDMESYYIPGAFYPIYEDSAEQENPTCLSSWIQYKDNID